MLTFDTSNIFASYRPDVIYSLLLTMITSLTAVNRRPTYTGTPMVKTAAQAFTSESCVCGRG